MPIKFADTAKPNNTTTATGKGTFPVAKADDVWFNDGDSLEEKLLNGDLGNSESIQVNELPEANEENQETILQYIGDTDDNYVNGLFYQCIVGTDDNGDIIYKWVEKEVQNSIKVSQEEGNLIILKDDGIFAEQKASSVDCIACDDIGNLEDIIEGQYYYNISDGLIYLIKDGNFTEVNVTADEIEITKELYATLSEEQKNLDVTWFVSDMENPFDQVDVTSAVIGELQTNHTDTTPTEDSTNYVTSGGVHEAIQNAIDKIFHKDSWNDLVQGGTITTAATNATLFTATKPTIFNAVYYDTSNAGNGRFTIYVNGKSLQWTTGSSGQYSADIFLMTGDVLTYTLSGSAGFNWRYRQMK